MIAASPAPAWIRRAVAASIVGYVMFAATIPSPLYALYGESWHYSSSVGSLLFAGYAFGACIALPLSAPLSDRIGRTPILLTGLGVSVAGAGLFVIGDSPAPVFVARLLQGIGGAVLISSGTAALIDADDAQHPRAATLSTVASAAGIALGAAVSAALAAAFAWPLAASGVLLVGVVVLLAIAVTVVRSSRAEPQVRGGAPHASSLRIAPAARRRFMVSALGVTAAWAAAGMTLALGPRLAGDLWGGPTPLAGAVLLALFAAASAFVQLARRGGDGTGELAIAGVALFMGAGALAAAALLGQGLLLVVAGIAMGCGWGAGNAGALRFLEPAIPLDRRAGMLSAFFLVAYLAISLPTIATGGLTDLVGVRSSCTVLAGATAVLAGAVAVAMRRMRPERDGVARDGAE
ncbi:MFS transporter [Microbacterium sp. NPDC096154]|uniref:MFS transporter n=1 Tax=Microbacterium sp. NPDC096154 TaxID=3155549 RepID=UPI00332CAACA